MNEALNDLPAPEGTDRDDPADDEPRYRSGAVARMLRMPVATLRVWERRYQVSQPRLSASGQRLYGAADVQRLALLKRLSDLGHAIGSLARLDMAQLESVAETHAATLAQAGGARAAAVAREPGQRDDDEAPALPATPPRAAVARGGHGLPPAARSQAPWTLLVVGKMLGARLKGPVKQALTPPGRLLHLAGPFETLAEAAAQPLAAGADALLIYASSLQDDWLERLHEALPGWQGRPVAVLYGFAPDRTCQLLARTPGLALLRGPQSDAALAQWLRGWRQQIETAAPDAATLPSRLPVPERRWDDQSLARFADLSSTIRCECPKHLADLLVQLSSFEAYSADCEHRSPEDAELHAYLRQMTALARAQFEAALERVARHEGLLPAA